jgi:uncharacterized protein (UPF0371 family)
MIDPFHLEAYGETVVNYNRDVEAFPVLNAMMTKITGESPYKSPTDMGVNMVGFCISDDAVCCEAANQEILRRYYAAECDARKGNADMGPVHKIDLLMGSAGISTADRPVVSAANLLAEHTGKPAAAIEMEDGTILRGRTTDLLGAASALLLNALKYLAGIDDAINLIPSTFIQPIMNLKTGTLGDTNPLLHINEILMALSVNTIIDPNAKLALEQVPKLRGLEAHSSVILSEIDERVFRQLGVNLTCEPRYETHKLYHK